MILLENSLKIKKNWLKNQLKIKEDVSLINDFSTEKTISIFSKETYIKINMNFYFLLSSRISRNIGENIFRSYTGTTSENTDFHVLVA